MSRKNETYEFSKTEEEYWQEFRQMTKKQRQERLSKAIHFLAALDDQDASSALTEKGIA